MNSPRDTTEPPVRYGGGLDTSRSCDIMLYQPTQGRGVLNNKVPIADVNVFPVLIINNTTAPCQLDVDEAMRCRK